MSEINLGLGLGAQPKFVWHINACCIMHPREIMLEIETIVLWETLEVMWLILIIWMHDSYYFECLYGCM